MSALCADMHLFRGEAIALLSSSQIILSVDGDYEGGRGSTDLPNKLAGSTKRLPPTGTRSAHDEIDLTDVTAPPLLRPFFV